MSLPRQGEGPDDHIEALLDRMSKDSFPASDPPQLEGLDAEGAPGTAVLPAPPRTHAPPPELPNVATAAPSPFDREGRYPLGEDQAVTVRTEGDLVHLAFDRHPVAVDAVGLEALIALLERHRPSLLGGPGRS
jgi:hypothetical protein